MAREIKVIIKGDTRQLDRDIQSAADAGGRNLRQLKSAIDSTNTSLGGMRSALSAVRGALLALGALNVLKQIGSQAIEASIAIDKQVNSLKALTGSAEAAQKRFQELFKIAQASPGLTTSLAATLDAQLRVFKVAESTINRLLPTIGRLNAISPLGDPRQFVNNLTQLITQNFERQDLKELVGQSPIAGRLIAEIFNVDNPTNAEAIRKSAKKLGINTVERLAEELVRAGENNSSLRNATESLAGQFEKMQDRITVALAPIGDQLLKVILPTTQKLVDLVEASAPKVVSILQTHQTEFAKTAKAVGILAEYFASYVGWISEAEKKFAILQHRFEIGFPILSGIVDLINRIDRYANRPDPNNPLGVRGGGVQTGRAVIVGDRSGLPTGFNNLLFPGGGGSAPVFVNNRGQILDSKGTVIGKVPPNTGLDTGDRTGAASASARPKVDLFLSAERQALENQRRFIEEQQRATDANMAKVAREAIEANNAARKAQLEQGRASRAALTQAFDARVAAIDELQRTSRRDLNRSGRFIDDALNRGQLTPEQAEALSLGANREFANRLRDVLAQREQLRDITAQQRDDLQDEIALYDRLGTAVSNTERFMRGFNSSIISVGDAFDRFGQNVARALTNTRDLLNGLKQSVLQFFNDLLGRSLQNLVGQVLAPIAGVFGGGGNLFRTPSTFPQSVSASPFQAIANAISSSAGGLSAPPSVTSSIVGGLPVFRGNLPVNVPIANASGGVLASATRGAGFSLANFGNSLASAAPLLGLTIGAGLGGQSRAGNILGAAGGLLTSTFISTTLGAPGALGSLAPALFSNPLTAIAGAGLLVGGILLGKAKQRRQDEELSGQYLTQAVQAIQQLASGVASGQIDVSQARGIFDTQILGTFRQQISGLKTKSVRESRLTNQVRDLEKIYRDLVEPAIAKQIQQRRDAARFSAIDSRLVPQFAGGGFVPGINRGYDSVLALLTPGEMVLTRQQQGAIAARAGYDIFRSAGVPGVQPQGGVVPSSSGQGGGRSDSTVIIYLDAVVDAEGIFIAGGSTSGGRRLIVNQVQRERKRGRSV